MPEYHIPKDPNCFGDVSVQFFDVFFGRGNPWELLHVNDLQQPLCEWLPNGIQATPSQANKPNLYCKYPTNI